MMLLFAIGISYSHSTAFMLSAGVAVVGTDFRLTNGNAAAVPFGVYAVVQDLNIPIQIQPACFGTLSLISWTQCMHYGHSWRTWTASLTGILLFLLFGGIEATLIYTLRPIYATGNHVPVTVVGGIAAICLAVGLLLPWVEIWKHSGQVVGIDWFFLTIDWSGAFFSLMSIVAQRGAFDIMGGGLYVVCLVLETGIFASQAIWLLRTRRSRRLEKEVAGIQLATRGDGDGDSGQDHDQDEDESKPEVV